MIDRVCPPIPDAEWPESIGDLREGFAGRLNVYRVMAHHPALVQAWAPLRQHIVLDTALGRERSEIVILRTAYRMGSDYEWSHHVSRARQLGISDHRIAALRATPTGDDAQLALAVDALVDERRLPSGLEQELADKLGREAVIDLMATVGFYSVLGYLLMTYETPIDPDIATEMAEQPI